MAMIKTYRLGLTLKFSGITVAGALSTGILVGMPTPCEAPAQTGDRRDSLPSTTHHFSPEERPSRIQLAKFNIEKQATQTMRPNAIHRLEL
jgi:hypothetical protein